jgi:uncharacterized protein (UPF0276 family)
VAVQFSYLGCGVGLRTRHYEDFLKAEGKLENPSWFEIISENFMAVGGRAQAVLERVRRDVPVVMHGVSLSIGATDALNLDYLQALTELAARVQPAWISDHLCWGSYQGRYAHDLLPLPYTEEALAHTVERVCRVQDILQRQILLENVSSYVAYQASTMSEWEFLAQVAERADCGILLDVNNIYVSARNHGFRAADYLAGIPVDRVGQMHLAGHSDKGDYLLDTHDGPVIEPVWQLYRAAVQRFGRVSTLIEWDEEVPELPILLEEARQAATVIEAVTGAGREKVA